MWKALQYTKTGIRNEKCGLPCQDYVCSVEKGELRAVALADGEGETELAHLGAEYACKTLTALLTECFEELWEMEDGLIQFHVITNVQSKLYELCSLHGVGLEAVHSTLLGVAADRERFLCVHLGDGQIGVQKSARRVMLSYPENGVNRFKTYLTSGHGNGRHIRVCRGSVEAIEKFILTSDGWRECLKQRELFSEKELLEQARTCRFLDDVSFIVLYRENGYNEINRRWGDQNDTIRKNQKRAGRTGDLV